MTGSKTLLLMVRKVAAANAAGFFFQGGVLVFSVRK